ncbi:hypothetical protein Micbo1qcDRAFT_170102 [Microdochium bolleyi]|uniref:Uncharacterized protein n=1 Tax=Microdochium bolleyi TaxID=196109 RepID=A0A136II48_9PEZI|nr:hypothetical protein Micbo1qcDRAFT_170102 [Microdochium bolleyi]
MQCPHARSASHCADCPCRYRSGKYIARLRTQLEYREVANQLRHRCDRSSAASGSVWCVSVNTCQETRHCPDDMNIVCTSAWNDIQLMLSRKRV